MKIEGDVLPPGGGGLSGMVAQVALEATPGPVEATPGSPVGAGLAMIRAGLAELAGANLWALSDAEVAAGVAEVLGLEQRLGSARLGWVAELDRRGSAVTAGASSTGAWLRATQRVGAGQAASMVRLAAALERDLAATGAALAGGRISVEHARVIERVLRALPPVEAAVRARAEAVLVARAGEFDPVELAKIGAQLRHVLDPDAGDALGAAEEDAVRGRELFLSAPDAQAMVEGRFRLDAECGAKLAAALDPLAAPAPTGTHGPDLRSPARRRGDAFAELIDTVLDAGVLPTRGGVRPHLVVITELATLRAELGARGAEFGDGQPISAGTARRLACDARIIPMVLSSAGVPLDVGRATRSWPEPIRRAIITRDRHCAFPGCDRPGSWAEIHHIQHWADGGATAIGNGVALCGFHHRVVHTQGWTIQINPVHGHPEFIPPPWIDPERVPRRNTWRDALTSLRDLNDPNPRHHHHGDSDGSGGDRDGDSDGDGDDSNNAVGDGNTFGSGGNGDGDGNTFGSDRDGGNNNAVGDGNTGGSDSDVDGDGGDGNIAVGDGGSGSVDSDDDNNAVGNTGGGADDSNSGSGNGNTADGNNAVGSDGDGDTDDPRDFLAGRW